MIIDRVISAQVHVREVVDCIISTDIRFIFHFMANVQLTVSKSFGKKMEMHTSTYDADVSLAQEFQKHFSNA